MMMRMRGNHEGGGGYASQERGMHLSEAIWVSFQVKLELKFQGLRSFIVFLISSDCLRLFKDRPGDKTEVAPPFSLQPPW